MPATDPARRASATVITPAFNEERALPVVLEALARLRATGIEVVVVDDGSTDRTADVAREAGFRVVQLERNSGKAAAVRAGLASVETDKVVVMDADATYPVEAIPEMVRMLDEYDMVVGVRTSGREHIPPLNRIGNALLRTAVHWFSGFRSADPLTGLYALRRKYLEAMQLDSDGFGLEVEICVKAARMGVRSVDFPITYGNRIGDSKLNAFRDGVVITSTLIRTLFRRPRLRPLPGKGGVPAAPLAVVATTLSVVLLSVAAVLLVTTVATSLAAIVDPTRALTLAPARFGLAALFAGLIGWRISTHWGRPPAHALIRLALGAVAAGAALVLISTRAAEALGVVPDGPAFRTATATLFGTAVVVGTIALVGLGAVLGRRGFETVRTGPWTTAVAWVREHAEAIAVLGALLLLAIPILRFISLGQLLGFDEAVYAATARSWVLDTPNTAWVSHRSPGISALGLPMAVAEWDAGVRLVGFAFSMGAVVAGWALGRRLAGPAAGVLAALLIAAIPSLQLNGALFLTDVPSATGILVLMLVLWRQVEERARPNAGLLWLAPLAAAVFYIRYGASVPILFLAVTAFLLRGGRLVQAWRITLATAALLAVLLVPHFVQSTLLHGNPLAIALSAQTGASPTYPGEALREYLRMVPSELAGPVGGLLLVLGVLAWPIRVLLHGFRDRSVRAHTLLVVPAVGQFLLLGLVALPQARYVLLPVMLLLIAGALTAVDAGRLLSRAWRTTLAAGLAAAVIVGALGTAAVMTRLQAEVTPASSHLIDAARLIRGDAGGRSCSILGYPTPELIWYSGCAAQHFGYPPVAGRESTLTGERRYLLLSTTATDREPGGTLRDEYLQLAEPEPLAVVPYRLTGEPALEVYSLPAPD